MGKKSKKSSKMGSAYQQANEHERRVTDNSYKAIFASVMLIYFVTMIIVLA